MPLREDDLTGVIERKLGRPSPTGNLEASGGSRVLNEDRRSAEH